MATSFNSLKTALDAKDRVTFGKHEGALWGDVSKKFPDYIIWCVGNTNYKFTYELIVASIKNKYKLQKDIKEQNERELASMPKDAREEILRERDSYREAAGSARSFYSDTGRPRYSTANGSFDPPENDERDAWAGVPGSSRWDDDIPF